MHTSKPIHEHQRILIKPDSFRSKTNTRLTGERPTYEEQTMHTSKPAHEHQWKFIPKKQICSTTNHPANRCMTDVRMLYT